MSEQTRRPAHDVILEHLESVLRESETVSRHAERQNRFVLLCRLLSEIAIPDENKQDVCDKLRGLVPLCNDDYTALYCLKMTREGI